MFSGTLRINLDPFDSHTDDEIWIALQTAHLSEYVEGLVERLEYPVAEGGENLRYYQGTDYVTRFLSRGSSCIN